jgi:hypothetical protein
VNGIDNAVKKVTKMTTDEFLRLARVLELYCRVPSDPEKAAANFESRFAQEGSESSRVLACRPFIRYSEDPDNRQKYCEVHAEILTISTEDAIRLATTLLGNVAVGDTLTIRDRYESVDE